MNLGEVNKGAVIVIILLLFGAGGYLWWKMLYTPAVAARDASAQAATAAETELTAAKQRLSQAQQQAEEAKKEVAKLDDSVARLAKSRTAIPPERLIDDATITLVEYADRAGVQLAVKTGDEEGADQTATVTTGASGLDGATPIDIEFTAAGTYSEMMHFMQLAESTVEVRDGKAYTRGRLFNVVQLKIGDDEAEDAGGDEGFGGSAEPDDETGFVLGKNDIVFKVVVRMYSSSTSNNESVGAATPDPAAAPTDPAAGGTTDPNAAGGATDPNAAGGTPDPAATGGTTDPAAGGTTAPGATSGTDPLASGAGASGGVTT
jgi:hypothetical protein